MAGCIIRAVVDIRASLSPFFHKRNEIHPRILHEEGVAGGL